MCVGGEEKKGAKCTFVRVCKCTIPKGGEKGKKEKGKREIEKADKRKEEKEGRKKTGVESNKYPLLMYFQKKNYMR